ncbi:hypothetical protein TNIN_73861 [Trichonephila inaurata madagascariensis]|uniref:Uncharacterized protein n=1 Tax=Trichonephila inaurata madagascariensis TaxID=2747483 RepID=A0A8X6Y3E3_9ARAC|nr:hypothetical protein TNIN_73861 [Trichonephila inaurata madagascariensis]
MDTNDRICLVGAPGHKGHQGTVTYQSYNGLEPWHSWSLCREVGHLYVPNLLERLAEGGFWVISTMGATRHRSGYEWWAIQDYLTSKKSGFTA